MFGRNCVQMIKNGVEGMMLMLFFADDLVLMIESPKNLRIIIEFFYRVCLKRVGEGKNNVGE